jgi:gamma-glutamyltranspeptidase/glutathione hydrolase
MPLMGFIRRDDMDIYRIEDSFKPSIDGKAAFSIDGMVATAFPQASQAGVTMLDRGGNAVDAAVAAAMALSVCEPQASGLGGQTMAVLHMNGRTLALDGSSRVPSLAVSSNLVNGEQFLGYRATTVPSTPAVLGYMHLKFGSLAWEEVLAPAIQLAKEGYALTGMQCRLQERELQAFLRVAPPSGAQAFLRKGRYIHEPGQLFIQPDLAQLLELLAEQGPRAFYLGPVAERIDADMKENRGFLRAEDLALIPWPIERPCVERYYRDIHIATMPPPGAGRDLCLVMMVLGNMPPDFLAQGSPASCHFLAETFRKTFLQRRQHPIGPNHYLQSPDRIMTNPEFARSLAISIQESMDSSLPLLDPPPLGGETTHISVMDAMGNAISLSQSIESIYGSKAAAAGLGFMYNNYLNTMETKDPSHPYYLRPGAVPWSSVAPTIMFLNSKPWLAVGSPGSDRIYSAIAQFMVHLVDGGCSLYDAMAQPRLHCSLGGVVSIETGRFEPAVVAHLEDLGYQIDNRRDYSFYLGAINATMRCQTRPGFMGVSEVRRDSMAVGPQ